MKVRRPVRHVVLVVFREDRLDSRTYRVPLWMVRAAAGLIIAMVILSLLGLALYLPVARTAARVPALRRDVARLETENAQIQTLAAALDSVETGYRRLRQMLGADLIPDPTDLGSRLLSAPAILARLPDRDRFDPTVGVPRYWPLDEPGYVTRGASDSIAVAPGEEIHPGLDIAVREGSVVRATAAGTVLVAGEASDYGLYVLLRHADGYESMYGHLSRITVPRGVEVEAGAVLGLTGNTGRSTAPHLHFEIRRQGRPVDPATLVKEES